MHECGMPLGEGDRDPGGYQRPLPRRESDVDGGEQVRAGVTGMGVGGQRQVRIEPTYGDLEVGAGRHGPTLRGGRDRRDGTILGVETRLEYQERLGVPLRWWAQGTMLVASFWLALIVAVPAPVAWTATGVAMALLALGLTSYGEVRIRVGPDWFAAGRARIEAGHLGAVEALDAAETRRVSGPAADARAYLVLRPYVKRAVRVEVLDPDDPVPYWLVSSRHPEALAAALAAHTTG